MSHLLHSGPREDGADRLYGEAWSSVTCRISCRDLADTFGAKETRRARYLTIVNLSFVDVERAPGAVAVMMSVYLPGFSFRLRESQP